MNVHEQTMKVHDFMNKFSPGLGQIFNNDVFFFVFASCFFVFLIKRNDGLAINIINTTSPTYNLFKSVFFLPY